jgi:hypothetical protein|nr:MAG: hypothetical protein [Bacteriophage sp.]
MGIEVDDLDIIAFGAPPPPEESVLVLPVDDGLEAISRLVCQDGVRRIETETEPSVAVGIDRVAAVSLDRISSTQTRALVCQDLAKTNVQVMEQLAVVGLNFVLLSRHLQHLLRDDRERVSDGVSLGWSILKFQPIELFSQFLLRSLLSMVKNPETGDDDQYHRYGHDD